MAEKKELWICEYCRKPIEESPMSRTDVKGVLFEGSLTVANTGDRPILLDSRNTAIAAHVHCFMNALIEMGLPITEYQAR